MLKRGNTNSSLPVEGKNIAGIEAADACGDTLEVLNDDPAASVRPAIGDEADLMSGDSRRMSSARFFFGTTQTKYMGFHIPPRQRKCSLK
jgi:hypothetical protein